jgi:hypothetical protein
LRFRGAPGVGLRATTGPATGLPLAHLLALGLRFVLDLLVDGAPGVPAQTSNETDAPGHELAGGATTLATWPRRVNCLVIGYTG